MEADGSLTHTVTLKYVSNPQVRCHSQVPPGVLEDFESVLELLTAYLSFTMMAALLQGKLEECEPLYLKVITILEKTGSPNLPTAYNNLGMLYKAQVL